MTNFFGELIKTWVIVMVLVFVTFMLFLSFGIDIYLTAHGKDPYFFDPDKITSYEQPIFTDIEKELLAHYESKKNEIHSLKRNLMLLPKIEKLSVEYVGPSEVSISARYKGGSMFSSNFEYKSKERKEAMEKMGLSPGVLDRLHDKLEEAGCISFEKYKGLRVGIKDDKSGTFYYTFTDVDDPPSLQDSCLMMGINEYVYLEYKGSGRGPDCIKNKNPEGFDERNIFQKWLGLIWDWRSVFGKE